MTSELRIQVDSTADTQGIDRTADALEDLADQADDTQKSTKGLGGEVDKTSKKTEGLGDKSKRTSEDVRTLDQRIVQLKSNLKSLGAELERDGGDKSLLAKFRSDSNELRGLQRTRKEISGLADDVKDLGKVGGATASTFSSLFQGGIINALKTPAGGIAAASVAVPATIGIGALAGGAVTAGVGAGVAGAGIAGAAMQSEKVRAEWARTTAEIKDEFLNATTSFEGPTIDAIRKVREALLDIDAKKIFGDAAKFVEPLADGAAKAVVAVGHGVEALVSRGEPAVRALGDLVADVGDGIGDAMETISGGSEGGAKAIRDFGRALNITLNDIGYFVRGMEEAYDGLDKFRNVLADYHPVAAFAREVQGGSGEVKVLSGTLDYAADKADKADRAARGLSTTLSDMTSEARIANDAFSDLFGTAMNLDEANLRVKQGMADLAKTAREGGASQDEVTDKVLRQIQALKEQRDAQLATGDGSQAATDRINANYRAQLDQLKKMFPWLAALIEKYEEMAKPLTKHIDIIIQEKRIGDVSVEGVIVGGDQRRQTGRGFASGTRNAPPGLAWTGENGPELVDFKGGETVYTASQSKTLAGASSAMPGVGGGGTTRIELVPAPRSGDALMDELVRQLRARVRNEAGGDVTEFFAAAL